MGYLIQKIIAVLTIASIFAVLGSFSVRAEETNPRNRARYIVVYRESVSDAVRDRILRDEDATSVKRFHRALSADTVIGLNEQQLVRLRLHPSVVRIDEDVAVRAIDTVQRSRGGLIERRIDSARERRERGDRGREREDAPPAPPAPAPEDPQEPPLIPEEPDEPPSLPAPESPEVLFQPIPWGVSSIGAPRVWGETDNRGAAVKVGVIDTGIDLEHPDLAPRIKGNINTVFSQSNGDDDNGHGSHVAGIIGALHNSEGVVGVAPDADLYAIKALDRRGSGYLSDVIEGIDWAISNGMNIINMSLGTGINVESFREVVQRAHAAGIIQVAAAGNTGGSVLYPAAYPEVIAVAAVDEAGSVPTWSSRGFAVDVAAPGVDIYSTYFDGNYEKLSGTSMAAPHVAGTVALILNTAVGTNDIDNDGKWDFAEVRDVLRKTARDKGSIGFDVLYGWGIVDAFSAAQ